jgi:hypothetical protein
LTAFHGTSKARRATRGAFEMRANPLIRKRKSANWLADFGRTEDRPGVPRMD